MRYLLFISEDYVLVHAVGRSEFSPAIQFQNCQVGREQFARYLDERTGALFCGALDSVDDEYLQQPLPGLRFFDQRAAVKNIVKKRSEEAQLWRHALQEVSTDGGKTRRVSVTTVPEGSRCAHWLKILRQKHTLLPDLCLLADLCTELQPARDIPLSVMVLSIVPGDYRIIGFLEGTPAITRKLKMTGDSIQSLVAEIDKTLTFLNRSGEQKDGDGVVTYVGDATALQREVLAQNGVIVKLPDEVLAGRFKRKLTRPTVVELLLNLMMARDLRGRYRLAGDYRAAFGDRRMNHAYFAGILCCIAVSAGSEVAGARIAASVEAASTHIEAQSAVLDQKMVTIRSESLLENDIDAVRRSVEVGHHFNQLKEYTPMQFLLPLATQLSRFPDVHVMSVDWKISHPIQALEGVETADSEAVVTGYMKSAEREIGELARSFNRFVSGLEQSDQIVFVDVLQPPIGFRKAGSTPASRGSGNSLEFTINFGVQASSSD